MAVANTKSTHITNADATPPVLTSDYISKGRVFETVGVVEALAADDALSVYRLARLPSNARPTRILVASDAISGASACDVGVYKIAANGGAAVSGDFFATDIVLTSATGWTEVINEATATDIDKVEKRLWELLGLSADPQTDYDICITANDVLGAGTLAMKVSYVI